MNALTQIDTPEDEARLLRVMRDALYPGAREDSVRLVLEYCRARRLDPMKKPVHIVPMYVDGGYRDVPMPGINSYRVDAARTGEYDGKSEPEFGPTIRQTFEGRDRKGNDLTRVVSYPEWCRVTVMRRGKPFVAREYWLENYATTGRASEVPNDMWTKRPFGQIAKCAEAQALRMAFPEETGGQPIAEEMEGKEHASEPREVPNMAPEPAPRVAPPVVDEPEFDWMTMQGRTIRLPRGQIMRAAEKALAALEDAGAVRAWRAERGPMLAAMAEADGELASGVQAAIDARMAAFEPADTFPGDLP